jgi:RimJ/RimL family protein N-acetyltransferase
MAGPWPAAEQKLARAKSSTDPLRFDIRGQSGGLVAKMRPLLETDIADDELVATIARWREKNKERFLTIIPFDPEGTRQWIKRFPVGDPKRILFLVEGPDGERLGHYGLLIIGNGEVEIDNTLRGSVRCPAGLFGQVAQRIIRWVIDDLGAKRLIVRVMSNNPVAIRHQERNGFIQESVLPLRETRDGDIVRREVVASASESNLPFGLAVLSYPIVRSENDAPCSS